MKKKYDFCLSVALLLTAFLLAMSGVRKKEEALAARLAPEILRFHVLANSDAPEDQALKLEVKDYLLEEIRHHVSDSRESILSYIGDNQDVLEQSAEQFMAQRGFEYPAQILLETCEFPQKTYGDMTFPAGVYEAVRVVLGNGEGQNFWCVLYPSLCYLDSTYAVVPDSSKEQLQSLISEDDFQALLTARKHFNKFVLQGERTVPLQSKTGQDRLLPRFKIRFKLAECFKN